MTNPNAVHQLPLANGIHLLKTGTREEARQAALTVCELATDVAEAKRFVEALGLDERLRS